MPIDRNRESSEAGETQPLSIEQQIEQGRPERDAWRAANWDKIDLNRPEYDREPEPFTLEVLGLTGADHSTDDADDPEPAAAYRSPEDVREALMEGKSASEVRRELRDQGAEPGSGATTELVRQEGELDFELGAPAEIPGDFELGDGSKSTREKARNELSKAQNIENIEDAGKRNVNMLQRWIDRPNPTGSTVGTPADHPFIQEARSDDLKGGEMLIAPVVLLLVGDSIGRWVRGKVRELRQSRQGEPFDAGN